MTGLDLAGAEELSSACEPCLTRLIPWFKLYNFRTRVLFMYVDTQNHLYWLPMVDTSEQSNLLPGAYLHVALEQVAGEDEMLDLIRAFVDARYTQVAVPAFERHLAGIAHAALNLQHAVNDTIGHVRAVQFRHACLVAVIQPLVNFPRRLQRPPFFRVNPYPRIGNH